MLDNLTENIGTKKSKIMIDIKKIQTYAFLTVTVSIVEINEDNYANNENNLKNQEHWNSCQIKILSIKSKSQHFVNQIYLLVLLKKVIKWY